MKHEVPKCWKCHKPLYPISLLDKDRKRWCDCYKVGVNEGWSGWKDVKKRRLEEQKPRGFRNKYRNSTRS